VYLVRKTVVALVVKLQNWFECKKLLPNPEFDLCGNEIACSGAK